MGRCLKLFCDAVHNKKIYFSLFVSCIQVCRIWFWSSYRFTGYMYFYWFLLGINILSSGKLVMNKSDGKASNIPQLIKMQTLKFVLFTDYEYFITKSFTLGLLWNDSLKLYFTICCFWLDYTNYLVDILVIFSHC